MKATLVMAVFTCLFPRKMDEDTQPKMHWALDRSLETSRTRTTRVKAAVGQGSSWPYKGFPSGSFQAWPKQ